MRGRWADGIEPRNLIWVLKDRLAVCERPGGYGPNHRSVRRTEEIIWIRRHEFTAIVSLLVGPHNLHSYDEGDMPYVHMPLGETPQAAEMLAVYEELACRMEAGERLLMHHERVDDVLGGFPRRLLAVARPLLRRALRPARHRAPAAASDGPPGPRGGDGRGEVGRDPAATPVPPPAARWAPRTRWATARSAPRTR